MVDEAKNKIAEFLGVEPEFLENLSIFEHNLYLAPGKQALSLMKISDLINLKRIYFRLVGKKENEIDVDPKKTIEGNLGLTKENLSTIRKLHYFVNYHRSNIYEGRTLVKKLRIDSEDKLKKAFEAFKQIPETSLESAIVVAKSSAEKEL